MMSRSSYKRLLDNDPDLEQRSPGPLLESNSQLAQEHARTSVTSRTRPAIPTQPEPQLSNPRRRKPVASAAVGTTGVFQATRPSGSAPIIPRQGALSAAIAASRTDGKGPRRTTRTTQKLTFLTDELNVDRFEVVGDDDTVRPMIALRDKLPRVTAYCTAGSYKMDALFEFLMSRREINSTAPKRFDEAIYTPFSSTGDPIDALVSGRPPEIISEAILGPKNLSHGQLGRAYIRVPKDNNTDLQLSLGAPVMSTSAPESFRSPPPTPSRVIGAKHDGVKIGTSEPGSGSTTPQILPAIKPVRRHSLDSELQSSNIEVSRFASASNQFGSDEYLDNAGSGTHRHLRFNESVKIGTFETPGETEEPDESRGVVSSTFHYDPFSVEDPYSPASGLGQPYHPTVVEDLGGDQVCSVPLESLARHIAPIGECVFFEYGAVVMWGLTVEEETMILQAMESFEEEKLGISDIESDEFHFAYNSKLQPRIYNDIITLKNPGNIMVKLTISHALAQSAKLAHFESRIEQTILGTKHIPQVLKLTGKIDMPRTAINRKIGELFAMRIDVNLVSNVLDTPEIFWSEPRYEPLYSATRRYLEISPRVETLNQRVNVISDLLDMLKDHQTSSHGELLEWIVIILILFEIIVGVITLTFDYFGYRNELERRLLLRSASNLLISG